ncbi:PREDICTED: uncharacterized protein LOC104602302 [Nelumbo nucifera]|uniref:Uncharacterized protein LOC104602302 n=2 Tax=Nelumbo nucifera TaxID=4432 RepID=A0A1U8AN86_NELNU|nr:PREDICTED: uncharacterized protein LOC104602302 [Nelumbo nucifera]DAD18562.1 TPA_asm: hypothetical protein HUJ06_020025 [Nelumbo nucifera]
MATGWVKSLQCKSKAFEDVYHPNPKNLNHLLPGSSCRKSVQNLKDVVETTKKKHRKTNPPSPVQPSSKQTRPAKNDNGSYTTNRVRRSTSSRYARTPDPFFPSLTELTEEHPSRNIVEIIFHTSWSPKAFSGRIEMIFKVQNLPKTLSRFEDYREVVKARASSRSAGSNSSGNSMEEDVRCIADGNEMMRFYCLGPTSGGLYDASGMCLFSGKETAICTFSGSGGAHECAGGGKGRRAMLVCRVIAGRVCKRLGLESLLEGRVGFDSVSGENGELLVFDSRAVLPCFLIIYKL